MKTSTSKQIVLKSTTGKALLLFIALLLNSSVIYSQAPCTQWQKTFGGSADDWTHAINETSDGGFICAGYTASNDGDVTVSKGSGDCWIVKLDNSGTIQWQQSLGGSQFDYAYDVKQTTDGGYIVAGSTSSNDGDVAGNHGLSDFWVIKLNSAGAIQWQRVMGGSADDDGQAIQQTADGGYIVAGYSESNDGDVTANHGNGDAWIVKLNCMGVTQWQMCLGGSSYDFGQDVQQTSDGGYILTGNTYSNDGDVSGDHGGVDCWVVKLNSQGSLQWQNCLGGTGYDCAQSVKQTTNGGFIVAGYSVSNDGNVTGNHGGGDCWVFRLDSAGVLQWQKALGGTGNDYGFSVQQAHDGGFVVAGYSENANGNVTVNHGGSDLWLIKLHCTGATQWQKSYGGTDYEFGYCVAQTHTGDFVIAGTTLSNNIDVTGNHGADDCWVLKVDSVYNGMPGTPGTISASAHNVCAYIGSANNVIYSIAPTANTTSYVWTVPAGATLVSGQGTNSINVSYSGSFTFGYITVKSVSNCGSSVATKVAVTNTVPPAPGAISASASNVCAYMGTSNNITYQISPIGTAVSYFWTVPAGATLVSGQGTTSITVNYSGNFSSGSISVQCISGCGNSAARSLAIIRSLPAVPGTISTTSSNVCAFVGTSSNVTYSISPVANALSYWWTVPAGATIVSGQGTTSIDVNYSSAFSSGYVGVRSVSGCGNSGTRSLAVTKTPAAPGAINGPHIVCGLSSATYSICPVPYATSYSWTAPAGATIVSGQGTTSIVMSFGTSFVSGNMSVKALSACGSSITKIMNLSRNLSEPGAITGPGKICGDSSANYSVLPVTGALYYKWTVPAGLVILSGDSTNNITVGVDTNGFISGTITVFTVNSCGQSPVRSFDMIVCAGSLTTADAQAQRQQANNNSAIASDIFSNLYPNPAAEFFTVELNIPANSGNSEILIEIYDATGKLVSGQKHNTANGSTIKTNLEGFEKGLYMVRLSDLGTNFSCSKTLIKQ